YIRATFEASFEALSPNHPFADEEGIIEVEAGDRIPGVPDHHVKLGAEYLVSDELSLGLDVLYNSGQRLRGDESNQVATTDGFAVVNLRAQYRLHEHLNLFAAIQ